jgi:glutamyl/glutaminyl-tRNA synthetase
VSVNEYRVQGILPEALLNYLALIGWNPGSEREIFTLPELVGEFTLDRVHKAGAVFDIEKLKWFNHEHLKKLTNDEYDKRLKQFSGKDIDPRLVLLIKERAQTLIEAVDLLGEYDFLGEVSYEPSLLLNNGKIAAEVAKKHLEEVARLLGGESVAEIKERLMPYADQEGRGDVLWPLRVALSGKEKSPDPFTLAALLGEDEARRRIAAAAKSL